MRRQENEIEFSIYRYNPDVDDAPRMQDYTLEAEEGRDMIAAGCAYSAERERSQPVVPPLLP